MSTSSPSGLTVQPARLVVILAWAVVLFASALPNILWREWIWPEAPGGLWLWVKSVGMALLIGGSLLWSPLAAVRPLLLALLLMLGAESLGQVVGRWTLWQQWFGGADAPFTAEMLGIQLRRFGVALIMLAGLRLMGFNRRALYLTPGRLDAPMRPVPWLGFREIEPWTRFGGRWALFISLGTLLFLILGGRPSPQLIWLAVPMLPMILLFAAMNAFSEEATYRVSLLATLVGPVGERHALWVSAAFFGIGHFYGVPYGLVGVVMATFLGWLLGKAMLETRGFFWAWFIHFLQDVLIFSFMAVGSITPGGG